MNRISDWWLKAIEMLLPTAVIATATAMTLLYGWIAGVLTFAAAAAAMLHLGVSVELGLRKASARLVVAEAEAVARKAASR